VTASPAALVTTTVSAPRTRATPPLQHKNVFSPQTLAPTPTKNVCLQRATLCWDVNLKTSAAPVKVPTNATTTHAPTPRAAPRPRNHVHLQSAKMLPATPTLEPARTRTRARLCPAQPSQAAPPRPAVSTSPSTVQASDATSLAVTRAQALVK